MKKTLLIGLLAVVLAGCSAPAAPDPIRVTSEPVVSTATATPEPIYVTPEPVVVTATPEPKVVVKHEKAEYPWWYKKVKECLSRGGDYISADVTVADYSGNDFSCYTG